MFWSLFKWIFAVASPRLGWREHSYTRNSNDIGPIIFFPMMSCPISLVERNARLATKSAPRGLTDADRWPCDGCHGAHWRKSSNMNHEWIMNHVFFVTVRYFVDLFYGFCVHEAVTISPTIKTRVIRICGCGHHTIIIHYPLVLCHIAIENGDL